MGKETVAYRWGGRGAMAIQIFGVIQPTPSDVPITTLQSTTYSTLPVPAVSFYQIGHLSYLWSPECHAALTTPSFRGLLRTGFIIFIPFSMLLATVVGPSSAIAMQPRVMNFTIPDIIFASYANKTSFYPAAFLEPDPITNYFSVRKFSPPSHTKNGS